MLDKEGLKLGLRDKGLKKLISCLMVEVFLLANIGISYADTVFVSDCKTPPLKASAFVDIDTDGDGLGDTWEKLYFGDLSQGAQDDPDNDGYNNLWEFQHGTDPTDPYDPNYKGAARNKALEFLKYMMDNNEDSRGRKIDRQRRILDSYVDQEGDDDEFFGWTYDNALAIMAFENAGKWTRAEEVLDAYIFFQEKDPIGDGRAIRRAYLANKRIPNNNVDADDCSDWIPDHDVAESMSVGDMALMIIASLRYYEYTNGEKPRFLNFAEKMADWIVEETLSTVGPGGFSMNDTTDIKSTENNIDLYAAFMALYDIAGEHEYRTYGLHAKNFIRAMWDTAYRMFWTGTLADGIEINKTLVTGYNGTPTSGQPADTNTWGLLALGETDEYSRAIEWVEENCRVDNIGDYDFGYDFNSDADGIWFEGMAHTALAYQMLGESRTSDDILDQIIKAQDDSGGIMCAYNEAGAVTTSFGWNMGTELHVAPVAWFIFAVNEYNPFWNQPVVDTVPYEGGYDASEGKYVFNEPWAEASALKTGLAEDDTGRAMVDFTGEGADDKGYLIVDPGTRIVKYEWDFDGKGTFDWSSTETGDVAHWFTEIGVHNAVFRVTNDRGFVSTRGVTVKIDEDDLEGFAPPVLSGANASAISGEAPLNVTFSDTGSSDADGYVASYEWDFNGDGEYDSYSAGSAKVIHTYREAGAYEATLKITDEDGLTDTAFVAVEVRENPDAPTAKVHASPRVGEAPRAVVLSASGSSGDITSYEWDFEGDGSYDWVSTSDSSIAHLYGEPGTYEARLKVSGRNGTDDTDTVKVRVRHNYDDTFPEAVGTVDVNNGFVPLEVVFTHAASTGTIEKYEWDFDGDKHYDTASSSDSNITYTYQRPGYYRAALRVTDENGLSHRSYVNIIAVGPDQAGGRYASQIISPKNNEKIHGDSDSLTVSVELTPYSRTQDVRIQYRRSDGTNGPWADITEAFGYPYKTRVDITSLTAGSYDFQAWVNGNGGDPSPITITIDSADWTVRETVETSGVHRKETKVKKGENTTIELAGGTQCIVEAGTLDNDATLTIRVPDSSRKLIDTGDDSVLYHTEFTISGNATFRKPITIVMPYDDVDNDGIVDGLGIPEEDLQMFVYNEDTGKWEPLGDPIVYPDDNYVTGTVTHFSIIGLGGGAVGASAGVSAVSSVVSGGIGSGRACFIATATYGTVMAKEVQALRYFRDEYLLTNVPGEFVIDMYEKYSPPIARRIENSRFLKGMVRFHLRPIITFARWANIYAKAVISHD